MGEFIDRAITELVGAANGHHHAAEVAQEVLERAIAKGLLPASGPNRSFVSWVAIEFEDHMAYDGHPLSAFLQPHDVARWRDLVAHALARAWRRTMAC